MSRWLGLGELVWLQHLAVSPHPNPLPEGRGVGTGANNKYIAAYPAQILRCRARIHVL